MEKINLFELNIDVDSVLQSQSELKDVLDDNRRRLKAYKDQGDTTSRAFVELEATTKNLNREYNASQTQLGKLIQLQGKEIKTVQQGEAALTIINKEWQKQASLFGENSEQADKLAKQHKELKDRTVELRKGIGDTSTNIGRYSEGFQEVIQKTGAFGQVQSVVNNVMMVSKPIVASAKSEYAALKVQYAANATAASAMSGAQKAVAVSTNLGSAALKLFKIALISTGIGAIVVLLGSLVAWFANTQEGIDFVNKALSVLGAAFDVITDRFSKFGGIVFGLISGQKSLSEALDETKEAFSGIGDELEREIRLAAELADELAKLERRQIATTVARSEINKQVKEQNKIAEDTSRSNAERQKAIEKAIELEKQQIQIENNLANDQLKNSLQLGGTYDENRDKIDQIRQAFIDSQDDVKAFEENLRGIGISETTNADIEAIGEAIIKQNQKITASEEALTTLGNKRNTINQQIATEQANNAKAALDASKKATDQAIKDNKIRLDLFIAQNEGEAESLEQGLTLAETVRDKKLALLQQEVEAGKKTQLEAELERLEIKEEFLGKQADLVIEFADKELEIYLYKNQTRIQNEQLLTDALVTEEQRRLDAIAEKQREAQQIKLEQGQLDQLAFNQAIDTINEENRLQKEAIALELKEQENARELIDLENRRAIQEGNFLTDLELRRAELQRQRAAELEAAEQTGADKALIEQKFAAQEVAINEAKKQAKFDIASGFLTQITGILGKESALAKGVAIAAVIADQAAAVSRIISSTGVANAKAVAASPLTFGQPFVTINSISAGASIATAIAQGARSVGEIKKAEKGMLVGGKLSGPRHSEGGIPIEAEGGEFIMNRRSTQLFYPLIDMMNRIGNGGVSGGANGLFRDGGLVQRSISALGFNGSSNINATANIDSSQISDAVLTVIQNMPRPVTDVKDIISNVQSYNDIVNGANI